MTREYISACFNYSCERKDTCLKFKAGETNNYFGSLTYACDGQREEHYVPIDVQKPIIKPNEIHYVIKFSACGTYFDESRYACNKVSLAKYYPTYQDAEQDKDRVIKIFPGVYKEELKIIKVAISEYEIEEE